jgi:hypothetical protein
MLYKYEMHTHTAEVSLCATAPAAALAVKYKDLGYDGICITDHFFNGNIVDIPAGLSWEEKVGLFCAGYNNALDEGNKIGLKVFFGWEYAFEGTHFLTYGLDADWLRAHPEIMEMSLKEYLKFVREEGAFVVHAHPFIEKSFVPMIRLLPRLTDAVEVNNANAAKEVNFLANQYAENYGLIKSAGSDTHHVQTDKLNAVTCSEAIADIRDLIDKFRNGKIGLQSTI